MKVTSRLLVFGFIITVAVAVTGLNPASAYAAPEVVFADEFNGPLDTASWATLTPWSTRYTTGELEYYDPANVTFANDGLRITSERRPVSGYQYASGILTSLPRAKFSYGYFEMRAKLPKGQGVWPAFWLTNDRSLEIDVMEMLGEQPNRVYGTLHVNLRQVDQGIYEGPDFSEGYHTFAVDWQPTYVKWYVDDVLYKTYTGTVPSDPMWICLNTAIGGAWPLPPNDGTPFPQTYDIDYVRVYSAKPEPETEVTPEPETKVTPEPETKTTTAPAPATVSVYRFYNSKNGTHFYTASAAERDFVIATWSRSWKYEGVAYTLKQSANDTSLYRFYSSRAGAHFYTASVAERNSVIADFPTVYAYEGVAYNVSLSPSSGPAVYRFYNSRNGSHFYTASATERDMVIAKWSKTYTYEGPVFYLGQ
ncbi:MAG: family 16 glycosylhydrolase [Coriobacteriia bacterium]|nr:family 16 glycosylhydrolase [Coriobacteriia bacterium]